MLTTRTSLTLALLTLLGLAVPAVPAQTEPAEEVLCPLFVPEATVKYCIEITGRGCVVVRISTFGVPTDPHVSRKVCPLP